MAQALDQAPDTASSEIMDIQEIMRIMPHRYPLLLVDRIENIVPGLSATGIKCVTVNEPHFTGHFPTQPVMPGVLIIEALAQTAGALVIRSLAKDEGCQVYFMTIENAKFRKPVVPGDRLELNVTKIKNRGAVWKFRGEAVVDGVTVAEADYSAMIIEPTE